MPDKMCQSTHRSILFQTFHSHLIIFNVCHLSDSKVNYYYPMLQIWLVSCTVVNALWLGIRTTIPWIFHFRDKVTRYSTFFYLSLYRICIKTVSKAEYLRNVAFVKMQCTDSVETKFWKECSAPIKPISIVLGSRRQTKLLPPVCVWVQYVTIDSSAFRIWKPHQLCPVFSLVGRLRLCWKGKSIPGHMLCAAMFKRTLHAAWLFMHNLSRLHALSHHT